MTHTNQSAQDYQYGISGFFSDFPVIMSPYSTGNSGFQVQETWGRPFSAGIMGAQILISNTDREPFSNVYRIQAVTPWFTYDSGSTIGWASTGSFFFWAHGAVLTRDSHCNWTYSFTSFELWGEVNGGSLTLLASTGAQTMSGSGYDERLNCTALLPTLQYSAPESIICQTTVPTGSSSSSSYSLAGGYRYLVGATWTADPVAFDTTGDGGSCSCQAALPALTGSNSWTVTVGFAISGTDNVVSGTLPCGPHCTSSIQHYYTETSTFYFSSTSATVKGKSPNLLSQNVTMSWACGDNGINTSGGSNITSATPFTTCASMRSVITQNQTVSCDIPPSVACIPGSSCAPTPPNLLCNYNGQATLSWPTAPPCSTTSYSLDLAHDPFGIVYEASSDGTTIKCARYDLHSLYQIFTAFTGTCENVGIARGVGNDLLIVFDDGTDVWSITSTNAGETWSSPMSVGPGTWPEPAVDDLSGSQFIAIYDGTNYNLWRMSTGQTSFTQVGMIAAAPAGKAGLTVRGSVYRELVFVVSNAGTIMRYVSSNMGVTWNPA